MKKHLILFASLAVVVSSVFFISAVQNNDPLMRFNGMYIGKTNEIDLGFQKVETYNHLRFYEDGTVICQSVSGYDPAKVASWFHTGEGGDFERKGTYKLDGKHLTFTVNNDGTKDKELEGPKEDKYEGEIIGPDQMQLKITYSSGAEVETTYKYVADPAE